MKKVLLSLVLMIASSAVMAQIDQGTAYFGAGSNLNYTSNKFDGGSESLFNVNLAAGYFVAENFMLGAGVHYSSYNFDYGSFMDETSSNTIIQFFTRYYIEGLFLGLGYEIGTVKDVDINFNSILLQAGYAAFLNDFISLEPSINYSIGQGDNDVNSLGVNIGFGVYLNR